MLDGIVRSLTDTEPFVIAAIIFLGSAIVVGFGRQIGTWLAERIIPASQSEENSIEIPNNSHVIVVGDSGELHLDSPKGPTLTEDSDSAPLDSQLKILVEGLVDRKILSAILDYFCESKGREMYPCSFTIIDTQGSGRVPYMAKWAKSNGDEVIILLDEDAGGKDAEKKLLDDPEFSSEEIFNIGDYSDREGVTSLEDLFSPRFIETCVNEVHSDEDREFLPIEISRDGRHWVINEYEIATSSALNNIEIAFEKIFEVDFNKIEVVDEIARRIAEGDVEERELEEFKSLLWDVNDRKIDRTS